MLTVLEAVDPQLRTWVDAHNQLLDTIARRPWLDTLPCRRAYRGLPGVRALGEPMTDAPSGAAPPAAIAAE